MHGIKKRYFLNALFDLELGGYPTSAVRKTAAEMTVLFLPLLTKKDSVILSVSLPEDYFTYLARQGWFAADDIDGIVSGAFDDVVWGWNDAAVHILGNDVAEHPEVSVVAHVNNRGFCTECANATGHGVPGSVYCKTVEEAGVATGGLHAFGPLVVKPGFGGAGFGFIRIDGIESFDRYRDRCAWLCNHGGCTVEPWCDRIADLSSGGVLSPDGSVFRTFYHTQWVNRFGAFYGIYIDDTDPFLGEWMNMIAPMTEEYLGMVSAKGYYGPVGIDSFIYNERQTQRVKCAAGIEINGRYTMGYLAHLLREKHTPKKSVLFRFLGKKVCRLPPTYIDLISILGEDHYDPCKQEGILLCTPLRSGYGGSWGVPERSVFYLAATSRLEVERMDKLLRERLAHK